MKKERLKSVDFLKGIAILLVVFGHSIQYLCNGDESFHDRLFNYIYSFHMPLFMFISGLVSYKVLVTLASLKKRAYQLLTPFFICPLLASLVFYGKYNVNTLFNLFQRPEGGLWFLYVLFIICFYFSFVQLVAQRLTGGGRFERLYTTKKWQSVILIVSGIVIFALCSFIAVLFRNINGLSFDYGASLIAQHSVFYVSGMLAKIHMESVKAILDKGLYMFIPLWALLASFWEFGHKPTFIANPNLIVETAYYFITAYAGIFMILAICFKFVKQENNGALMRKITTLGTMTLGIYAIHLSFVMKPVSDWVVSFEWNYWISLIVVFIISTFVSILFVKIIELGNLAPQLLLGKVKLNN